MSNESGYKWKTKDTVIVLVFGALALLHIYIYIDQNGFTSIGVLMEQTILILLAFVGLIEVFHYVGWDMCVPGFMLYNKKQEQMKELQHCVDVVIAQSMNGIIKQTMEAYFEQEVNFLKDYSEQRVEFVMSQLGINGEQFDKIRLDLIKMRCLPLNNLQDAENKIKQFVRCGAPMVIDLTDIDPARRTYKDVNYYLNFNDAMYIDDGCRELANVMNLLICEKIGTDKFDRIVIPHDSNVILGVEIGKLAGKPVVKMRSSNGRVEREHCWDGKFGTGDRVLIVHDVLVSGKQIEHVLKNIPKSCSVVCLCCLAVRTEGPGLKKLTDQNIDVVRVVDLSDADIAKLIKN